MNLVPPLNLPLIKLPFLNSRESARAETAATLRATISRNLLCIPHEFLCISDCVTLP